MFRSNRFLRQAMTLASPTPIIIRPIKDGEYIEAVRLYRAAIGPSPTMQCLISKVDPLEWKQFTARRFKLAADEESDSVLVAQRIDTAELVGVALTERYSKESRPTLPNCQFPEGYNQKEAEQIMIPEVQFQEECLAKYGAFWYIDDFAVAPDYQGQGIGRQMAEHIIAQAKQSGRNIALFAASGKLGFYAQFGFEVAGKPCVLGNGMIEGPTPMRLVFPDEIGRAVL
ncbi:hypothetical protein QFC21_002251 [Naganishia friedmannii]|uniref:Uncharacterized protein n=1 Tax=Naganishia friedmannii TaxID=89922 RepID=A0ACC2VXK7_9TREE|nr:hypothetical protein QFC21_002251 [Naganishia friedmannii]